MCHSDELLELRDRMGTQGNVYKLLTVRKIPGNAGHGLCQAWARGSSLVLEHCTDAPALCSCPGTRGVSDTAHPGKLCALLRWFLSWEYQTTQSARGTANWACLRSCLCSLPSSFCRGFLWVIVFGTQNHWL